ncbi:tail fiber assembly protein [Escherichia coli]|uniref:tail fiber assembly protein n=1 Tax=Escherichia coli TaxID=562 RepID=UPI000FDF9CAB|nr:tail fiber assembly protein [Escherichia coli]QAA02004.1 tail fiber assembly protein [Escherichia coli]
MKNSYSFSPKYIAFYANTLKANYYELAGIWPDDAFEVSDDVTKEFTAQPPNGKKLGVIDGLPAWVDVPPPTYEEEVAAAELEKQIKIEQANDYINCKQWPGKAIMGRLSDADKTQYNEWLDYLDALEAVETVAAPDINWPTNPVSDKDN